MTEPLKPCPFCGGVARVVTTRVCEDAEGAWAECTNCRVETCCYEDAYAPVSQAVDAWNTRVSDARIKELEAALRRLSSPQAFGVPFYPKAEDQSSKELKLRMEYAGEILAKAKGEEKPNPLKIS